MESPYHIETSILICYTDQRTGLYVIGTSIIKELKQEHFVGAR